MVSLYEKGESSGGKNSPYLYTLPFWSMYGMVFMCSMILVLSLSKDSLVYCLFRMQYDLLRRPTQLKRFCEFIQRSLYKISKFPPQQFTENLYLESSRPILILSYVSSHRGPHA